MTKRDGDFVVFDRNAFRREVIDYVWGDQHEAREDERFSRGNLHGAGRTEDGYEFGLGGTQWEIGRERRGFKSPRLRTAMRSEFRREPNGFLT